MRTQKPKPACVEIYPWLEANLGKHIFGALTGTDRRSLDAAVMILEAYTYDRTLDVLDAFGSMVGRMQTKCRYMAFHAIAKAMNWEDRAKVWKLAGLELADIKDAPICEGEPGGKDRPNSPLEGWT